MYTIGQVAKFLGISRDTIKFYEEKGLVKPQQNKGMGLSSKLYALAPATIEFLGKSFFNKK